MRKTIPFNLDMEPQDYAHFVKMAYSHNRTPEDILLEFVSDLVCGYDTNGSEARDAACDYFDACMYNYSGYQTFCSYLIDCGDMESFLNALAFRETADEEEEVQEWNKSIIAMYDDYADHCQRLGFHPELFDFAIRTVLQYAEHIKKGA